MQRGDLFGASDVYEILVYDRVLAEEELRSLHQYLLAPRPRLDSDSTKHN